MAAQCALAHSSAPGPQVRTFSLLVVRMSAAFTARSRRLVFYSRSAWRFDGKRAVVVFADKGAHPPHAARCSMGFIVAIVWIMAIADEVVNVLKVRARALLSCVCTSADAMRQTSVHLRALGRHHWAHDIRGGNSLADLVANMSVACVAISLPVVRCRLTRAGVAPIMGFSACLAGRC